MTNNIDDLDPEQWASIMGLTDEDIRLMREYFPETWTRDIFADMASLLATDVTAFTQTKYGIRNDGFPLIYAGSHVAIYGEPGSGKTMIAKHVTAQAIQAGHRVLHIDIDGNFAAVIAQDVKNMGANPADMVELFSLAQPGTRAELDSVIRYAVENPFDLAIVDSVASLQAYTATDGDNATDYVQRVYMGIIKPLLDAGTTVLSIDHTAKAENAKGAAGTIQKRAKADLAFHVVSSHESLAKGRNGHVYLYVDKDRYSTVKASSTMQHDRDLAAIFRIPETGLTDARLETPIGAVTPDVQQAKQKTTRHLILDYLADGRIRMFTEIKQALDRSNDATRMALKRLIDEGLIVKTGVEQYVTVTKSL